MILQHTTNYTQSLKGFTPFCIAATGSTVYIGKLEIELVNYIKYWPGLYRS
jgi:hypothetical protein